MEAESRVTCLDGRGKGHSQGSLEAQKGKEVDSPLLPPEGTSPADTLTLAHEADVILLTPPQPPTIKE